MPASASGRSDSSCARWLQLPAQVPQRRLWTMAGSVANSWAMQSDGRTAHALIADKGDPGNRVTVKCLCESALALALDELPARAGFLTPSTGLGDALVKRLRNRGMELSVT